MKDAGMAPHLSLTAVRDLQYKKAAGASTARACWAPGPLGFKHLKYPRFGGPEADQ